MNLNYLQNPNKDLLRFILGMSRSKFKREMSILEDDIKKIYPRYNKQCSILPPKVFRFILEEIGDNDDSGWINDKVKVYYREKE